MSLDARRPFYPGENDLGDDGDTGGARAPVVNRTHRIVRDQAMSMRAQRRRSRSLWVPLAICSALLLVLCYAVWVMLAGYDLTPTGIPDASDQLPLLLLFCSLPVGAVALGIAWFRRGGQGESAEGARQ